MLRIPVSYFAALVAIGVLDFIWLRLVAMGWYEQGMGHLLAPRPNLVGAVAFYFLYPVGVLVFAGLPAQGDLLKAVAVGALFGAFC
ncbi:MAG: DUF2177 family protein, partial [Comamonadaceae bacterium]